jgi:hypothetical protein
MALVHDDDLARLDVFGDDTVSRSLDRCTAPVLLIFAYLQSLDFLPPGEVAIRLRRSKPEVCEVLFHSDPGSYYGFSVSHRGNVYMTDLSAGNRDANADTKPVRAAMLSGSHTSEGRREFYVPTYVTSNLNHF